MLDILRRFAGFETMFPPMQPVRVALENTISTTMIVAVIISCPIPDRLWNFNSEGSWNYQLKLFLVRSYVLAS